MFSPNSRASAWVWPMARGMCSSQRKRGTAEPIFCECGNHAFANLTKGFVALVSPEDADQFRYYWQANIGRNGYLCVSRAKTISKGKTKKVTLGREILCPPEDLVADHKDHNTLDSRRSNLRMATSTENACNRVPAVNSKTGVKGVIPHRGKFRASIKVFGKTTELGCYATLEEASEVYRQAAVTLHGDFAGVR